MRDVFVPRPFQGLADEPDWVALRELVPAATAPLRLAPDLVDKYGEREVTLATVLPMALPALSRPDGRILLGIQRNTQSGDVSRDLAAALEAALETEPGAAGGGAGAARPGRRACRTCSPTARSTSRCATASSSGSTAATTTR